MLLCSCSEPALRLGDGRLVVDRPLTGEGTSRPRVKGEIEFIVIHFCSDAVASPSAPYNLSSIYDTFNRYGVSAHYFIDRGGTIFKAVDESRAAFHAGKGVLPWRPDLVNNLNESSIGIELLGVGTEAEMGLFMDGRHYSKIPKPLIGFTDAQYGALQALVDDLCRRHPGIRRDRRHILGHDDYAPGRRTDPGKLFDWSRIGLASSIDTPGQR